MDAFRSSTSRRFYSSLNVVGIMLRTGSEGGCYEHIPLDKSGEDNQRIKLKIMPIKEPVPTVNDCLTLFSADMSQAKNGELLIVQVHFTRLRCTHTLCLSTWLHLRFSYRMKILLVVVSIVFCYQEYIICDKVQALSWTGRYSVVWTVRNLWRVLAQSQARRGRVFFQPKFPKINPTSHQFPPVLKKQEVATVAMSMW